MEPDNFEGLNKPGYKPRFVSEYSMGQFDFARYDEWLKQCEKWSAIINSTDNPTLEMVQNFFASLNVLWKCWRPIVSVAEIKEQVDRAVKEVRAEKRIWEGNAKTGLPMNSIRVNEVVDNLDEIYTKLMELKQVIGLGIVVKRNMTTSEKIKRGIHGDRDFGSLPEA